MALSFLHRKDNILFSTSRSFPVFSHALDCGLAFTKEKHKNLTSKQMTAKVVSEPRVKSMYREIKKIRIRAVKGKEGMQASIFSVVGNQPRL
jgi:hypothetical protein